MQTLVSEPKLRQVGELIKSKFEATVNGVKAVLGHKTLCEDSKTLCSLLVMRQPYTDPVNFVQVRLSSLHRLVGALYLL
jgi:phosphoenolpyruvate carboxylase